MIYLKTGYAQLTMPSEFITQLKAQQIDLNTALFDTEYTIEPFSITFTLKGKEK